MERDTFPNCLDEREEGEIIEDELEDVSDCSMSISPIASPLPNGKLLSAPVFSPAVSLSSVSDDDNGILPIFTQYPSNKRHRSKSPLCKHRRKKLARLRSKRTKNYVEYVSDDEDDRLNKHQRILLNKALQRESKEEILHNSLRTRLKSMLYNNAEQPSTDEEDLEALRKNALLSRNKEIAEDKLDDKFIIDDIKDDLKLAITTDLKTNNDSVITLEETEDSENNNEMRDSAHNSDNADITEDSELFNLRLAALKSAVLKKCQERRKRKLLQDNKKNNSSIDNIDIPIEVVEFDEIDKENNFVTNEECTKVRKSSETEKMLNDSDTITNCKNKNSQNDMSVTTLDQVEEKDKSLKEKNLIIKTNIQETAENDSKDKPSENNPIEEDADILRAMLLASMSQKLTKEKCSDIETLQTNHLDTAQVVPKIVTKKLQTMNRTNNKPTFSTLFNKNIKTNVNKPINVAMSKNYNFIPHKWEKKLVPNVAVKPLIINVNDSDSEDDSTDNRSTDKSLKKTVEQFLKQQRAEVEAKDILENVALDKIVKVQNGNIKVSVNLKKDANNQNPEGALLQSINFDNKTPNKTSNSINEFLQKSALKLLPKSQQIEYQRLKQKLLFAKTKLKIKRTTKPQNTSKNLEVPTLKVTKPLSSNHKLKSEAQNTPKKNVIPEEKALEALSKLKKILDDIQVQNNGRLQMKGKYQSLVPLLRKVNQASNERRQNENEVKKLLLQLQEARAKLSVSHQNFVSLVHRLSLGKEYLDKGSTEIRTSTPVKQNNNRINPCDITAIKGINQDNDIKNDPKPEENGTFSNEKPVSSNDVNNDQKTDKEIDFKEYLKDVEIVDPNDIEKVFVEQDVSEKPFIDYISPLAKTESDQNKNMDYLKELCPYDLFGVCKDKECPYRHCS